MFNQEQNIIAGPVELLPANGQGPVHPDAIFSLKGEMREKLFKLLVISAT